MPKDTATTLSSWDPQARPVQGFIKPGEYVNSDTSLLLAGPPQIDNIIGLDLSKAQGTVELSIPGTDNVFYPIGQISRFIKTEGKQTIPIFEIGSGIVQLIPTKTSGALSIDRTLLDAPSLLRAMTAVYSSNSPTVQFKSLISTFDPTQVDLRLKADPGRADFFLTLFSDLFNFPMGLLALLANQKGQFLAGMYFENSYITAHTISFDAGTNLLLEAARVAYSRSIPARVLAR